MTLRICIYFLPFSTLTLAYAVSASNTLDQLGLDPGSSLEISYTVRDRFALQGGTGDFP